MKVFAPNRHYELFVDHTFDAHSQTHVAIKYMKDKRLVRDSVRIQDRSDEVAIQAALLSLLEKHLSH